MYRLSASILPRAVSLIPPICTDEENRPLPAAVPVFLWCACPAIRVLKRAAFCPVFAGQGGSAGSNPRAGAGRYHDPLACAKGFSVLYAGLGHLQYPAAG